VANFAGKVRPSNSQGGGFPVLLPLSLMKKNGPPIPAPSGKGKEPPTPVLILLRKAMSLLSFTKMHGLGNDFMVVDATVQPFEPSAEQIRRLADRAFGVGFDQLLLVEKSTRPGVDFRYRIFNADGHEVEQCGNGARCFARFVREKGLTKADEIVVEIRSGLIRPRIGASVSEITVDMGPPIFEPSAIPFEALAPALDFELALEGPQMQTLRVAVLSMGNPHAVLICPDVDSAPVAILGPHIGQHPRFPRQANVGFMQVCSSHEIRLRVFERGSGETLACGTGACAAVVAGIRWGHLASPVTVHTRGGRLEIAWEGPGTPVLMTGPASRVFEGHIDPDTLEARP
jgi:diaminopimelate epimerase